MCPSPPPHLPQNVSRGIYQVVYPPGREFVLYGLFPGVEEFVIVEFHFSHPILDLRNAVNLLATAGLRPISFLGGIAEKFGRIQRGNHSNLLGK